MSSPAIILRSRYVLPYKKEFERYINYIDREDAKTNIKINSNQDKDDFNIFHTYIHYMDDEEKDGQLFDENNDYLNNKDKEIIKNKFTLAQKNESPMWQDVISFDNSWLEEIGLYDSKNGVLDEKKIKNIARETVREMASNEGMNTNNLIWNGAIHYNTDNIHVHLATVETHPTRQKISYKGKEQYKAKRKQKTLDKMKRTVAKSLYNRNKDFQKIDELIRQPVNKKRELPLRDNKKFHRNFHLAMQYLPKDRTQWKYGYHSINNARSYIDEISKNFMETFYPNELKELNAELDKQEDISVKLYGKESRANEYKQNKLDDLKKRLGNAVLQEMREYDKETRESYKINGYTADKDNQINILSFKNIKSYRDTGELKKQPIVHKNNLQKYTFRDYSTAINISRFNRAMRKTYHDMRKEQQMAEFDRMQEGIELE